MTYRDNAITGAPITASGDAAQPQRGAGLLFGCLGILAFSFSFPATKLAVDGLDPWFVAFGRAAVAGLLAVAYLTATGAPRPAAAQRARLEIVAGGVIVGFPLLTSLALVTSGSAHGAIVIAVLPAATALAAVARAGERPGRAFWIAAAAGLGIVLAFVLHEASGALTAGDALLLAGTACCALGYAEGGALARELGGARTISWALVLSLPLTIPVTVFAGTHAGVDAAASAWLGFAYVAVVSMFLGFFAWYAGLARGGVARIGQVQLSQPLLTVLWSALVLGEQLTPVMLLAGLGVLISVAATQRARIGVRRVGMMGGHARRRTPVHRRQRPLRHDDAAADPGPWARPRDPAGVDVPDRLRRRLRPRRARP